MLLCLFFHASTLLSSIDLELISKNTRHRTIYRTLSKETEFQSYVYREEFEIRLGCIFEEQHYLYDAALNQVLDACMEKSDTIYSALAHRAVQNFVKERDSQQIIIPISGMTLEDDAAFFVVPAGDNIFYLNIPAAEVQFLHEFEEKLRRDELMGMILSEEEVAHYNVLASLVHAGLRIMQEMKDDLHVCAYCVEALDDFGIRYHVVK
jgi:hypothetical protein